MCAEYGVQTIQKSIDKNLGILTVNLTDKISWAQKVKMTNRAPAVRLDGDTYEIVEKTFPVHPFPNARIFGIDEDSADDECSEQIVPIYKKPIYISHGATQDDLTELFLRTLSRCHETIYSREKCTAFKGCEGNETTASYGWLGLFANMMFTNSVFGNGFHAKRSC